MRVKCRAKRIVRVKSKPKRNERVKSIDQTMKKLPNFEGGQIWHKMTNFGTQQSKNRHMLKICKVYEILLAIYSQKNGGGVGISHRWPLSAFVGSFFLNGFLKKTVFGSTKNIDLPTKIVCVCFFFSKFFFA